MLPLYVAYGHGEHGPPSDAVYPGLHAQDVTPLLLVLQVCVAAATCTHCTPEYPCCDIVVSCPIIDAVCDSAVVHDITSFLNSMPVEVPNSPVHVRAKHDVGQAANQLVLLFNAGLEA